MGFHEFSSPYDWSRIASYKRTAKAAFGGMIDLSVGSPVDPVPDSVRKALAISSNDPNAYGYPVTAGTADLRDAIHEWFAAARNVDLRAIGADVVPTVGSKEGVALMRRCCISARAMSSCSRRCRIRRTRSARSWPARKR
mgnify:CR=1 FL=1